MSGRRWLGLLTFGLLALPGDGFTRGDDYEDGVAEKGETQFWRCEGCPAPGICAHITDFPDITGTPVGKFCSGRYRVPYAIAVKRKAADD